MVKSIPIPGSAGNVGARGAVAGAPRLPSPELALRQGAAVLADLAVDFEKDDLAQDGIASVEAEGKFDRETSEAIAKLDPTAEDYRERVAEIYETTRTSVQEGVTFRTREGQTDLEARLTNLAEAGKTLTSSFRREALAKKAGRLAGEAGQEALAAIEKDPSPENVLVQRQAQANTMDRLNPSLPPLLREALEREFDDSVVKAQIEGLSLQGRFIEARDLADAERDRFDGDEFKSIKKRIREVEALHKSETKASMAHVLATLRQQINAADDLKATEATREQVKVFEDLGFFADEPDVMTALLKSIKARETAIIKAGAKKAEAWDAFLRGSTPDRASFDLIWDDLKAMAQKTGQLPEDPSAAEYVNFAATMAAESGWMQSEFFNRLTAAEGSQNASNIGAAAAVLRTFREVAPAVKTGSHPRIDAALAYMDIKHLEATEAGQAVVDGLPADSAALEARNDEFNAQYGDVDFRDKVRDLGVANTNFWPEFIFGPDTIVSQRAANTFRQTLLLAYQETGDFEVAEQTAVAEFSRTWGETRVGGVPKLVKYPVESLFPYAARLLDPDQRSGLVNTDIREFLRETGVTIPEGPEGLDSEEFSLVADGRTADEIALLGTGKDVAVTWEVRVRNSRGVMVPWTQAGSGQEPLRWHMPTLEELRDFPAYKEAVAEQVKDFEARQSMGVAADRLDPPFGFLNQVDPRYLGPREAEEGKVNTGLNIISRAAAHEPVGISQTLGRKSRGVRNNNPGNIKLTSDKWLGQAKNQMDRKFVQFESPLFGIRALARTLMTYQVKYGIRTVGDAIARWAPAQDGNDTVLYIGFVASQMGVNSAAVIDLTSLSVLRRFTKAIIRAENGAQPFSDALIDQAIRLAQRGS